MLSQFPVQAHVPVSDIDTARSFYTDTLGLKVDSHLEGEAVTYQCGDSTRLVVFRTREVAGAGHTEASFVVTEIEQLVADLRDRGVTFDDVDFGDGMATVDGIADLGFEKAAWLRDPEGNTIVLVEYTP